MAPLGNSARRRKKVPRTMLARNQQAALDWTRNWTTHLVNQVRFSYVRAFTVSRMAISRLCGGRHWTLARRCIRLQDGAMPIWSGS